MGVLEKPLIIPDMILGHSTVIFFFLKFIYSEVGGKHECSRGRGRKRGKIPSRLYTESVEPDTGLELTNREIMT